MFEVDWADYECERVGQRRARKEVERELKKKDDANSSHGTISTRTSVSSNQRHLSFFGSIGRKKTITSSLRSREQEPTTSESVSTTTNGKLKRGSLFGSRTAVKYAAKAPDNIPVVPENEVSISLPTPTRKAATDSLDFSCPETPDRWSKESMLSRTTDLTIPMLESHRPDHSVNEIAQVAKATNTSSQHGRDKPSIPSRIRDAAHITASPRTPRRPRRPPTSHSPISPNGGGSASEFVDEWFTALHEPTRRAPRPGSHGTMQRGNIFMPPSLYRPLPVSPTSRPTERSSTMPPNPLRIRFLADSPDDWKSPDEWNHTSSTANRIPAPVADGVSVEDEECLSLIAADLKAIHNH